MRISIRASIGPGAISPAATACSAAAAQRADDTVIELGAALGLRQRRTWRRPDDAVNEAPETAVSSRALRTPDRASTFTRCLKEPGVAIAALHDRPVPLESALHQRLEHTVLASEEVIEGGFGNAGRFADFPDGGCVVALDREEIESGAQNPVRGCRLDDYCFCPCSRAGTFVPAESIVIIPTGKYTSIRRRIRNRFLG